MDSDCEPKTPLQLCQGLLVGSAQSPPDRRSCSHGNDPAPMGIRAPLSLQRGAGFGSAQLCMCSSTAVFLQLRLFGSSRGDLKGVSLPSFPLGHKAKPCGFSSARFLLLLSRISAPQQQDFCSSAGFLLLTAPGLRLCCPGLLFFSLGFPRG